MDQLNQLDAATGPDDQLTNNPLPRTLDGIHQKIAAKFSFCLALLAYI